jgi:hypothetical protein
MIKLRQQAMADIDKGLPSLFYFAEWSMPGHLSPLDEKNYCWANPSLGTTITIDALRAVSKKDSISDSLPDSLPSVNDSIKSSVSPKISLPVKKKTRKIKIISDEEFFKKETQKTKRKRCPKGTRRNKAGFCVEIVQKEKVDIVENEPVIVSEGTLQIESLKMKDKKKRCPKGTRKNKMGDCVPK